MASQVINYLLHMVRGTANSFHNGLGPSTEVKRQRNGPNTPIFSKLNETEDTITEIYSTPAITISERTRTDSLARYRSLDTLTSKNTDTLFPEPGPLTQCLTPKTGLTNTLSSPTINVTVEDVTNNISTTAGEYNMAIVMLKDANRNIESVISLLESNNLNESTGSVFDLSKTTKNIKNFFNPKRTSSKSDTIQNLSKPTVRNNIKVKSKSTSSSNISSASKFVKPEVIKRTSSTSVINKVEKNNGNVPMKQESMQKLSKRNALYAHVKSSIPKAALTKKK